MEVDLNCDLGEGAGCDAELMPLVSSANICCGVHAGNAVLSLQTLKFAQKHGITVGAHPGHDDRKHFGRREIPVSTAELEQLCRRQVETLVSLAKQVGVAVKYLKPHGGLYHQACRDRSYAYPIIDVASEFGLAVVGLPKSALRDAAQNRCHFVAEGYADRGYRTDGSLVPRDEPGAFVPNADAAVVQALWLIQQKNVRTLCVHGDNPEALAFVHTLRAGLLAAGISLKAFA